MKTQTDTLLDEILAAHGGIDHWRRFRGVASTILSGGMLWEIKGASIIRTPRRATTEFRRQWTRVTPFGHPDWTMTWTPERAEIADTNGEILVQRSNGREAFDRSYHAPWDSMNLAYFNGYAMWTYHAFPFAFAEPGYDVREIEPIPYEGELLRGLEVCLPDNVHSHSRKQRFYFSNDRLLRRHDYEVEVWENTPAAHFLSNYVDVDGLQFPRRRSVYALQPDGEINFDLNLVTIELSDYRLF